jgi:two-component system chemotaxis response regulator CheY
MSLKASMKILVVDDMSTMRKIIKNILSQLGFKNICEAEDGKKALAEIEKSATNGEPVEFIISDWNMPEMTGLDLLAQIRGNPKYKGLPFLMVTAEAEQGNIMIAVKAGVDNFIVKPFSAQILKEKIEKIFAKRT